jgi:glutamate-1-semialdehyde 2,1-aminomutase
MATTSEGIDRARVQRRTEELRRELLDRTPGSDQWYERAKGVMPRGVPSSFQAADPRPTYLSHGRGSHVWDVDGNEYLDFHNGFGVMCVGHANPAIVAAVAERAAQGTHFAAPTEGSTVVAEELRRRFALPFWRFTNSGTESTMDAVHLARAATGRDVVLKIEGSYHGHHDSVMVSVRPALEDLPPRGELSGVPFGKGHLPFIGEYTKAIPFNDADLMQSVLEGPLRDRVAAVIVEPAMMNMTIVRPRDGYLERVRELCDEHGAVLVFDEVKTGATIAYGGAVERFGVQPDVVCLAKAICGGLPGGAVGMTEALAEHIVSGAVRQVGTFNGNPLTMAAAQATLVDVLDAGAYERFEAMDTRLRDGLEDVIGRYGLPCHTVGLGSKGCVVFSAEPLFEYRDYATKVDAELSELAWLHHMTSGIYMTPGVDEQWTLSIQHADEDLDRYVAAFEAFARDATGGA